MLSTLRWEIISWVLSSLIDFTFQGDWAQPFNESLTRKEDFYVSEEMLIQLDFMRAERRFNYAYNEEMKLLALPYISEHLEMVFVLPSERFGLQKLEKSLTGSKIFHLIDQCRKWLVNVGPMLHDEHYYHLKLQFKVSIPKFKMETTLGLVETLKQLGLSEMFSDCADFSKISSDDQLMVSDVVHKAFLEVSISFIIFLLFWHSSSNSLSIHPINLN